MRIDYLLFVFFVVCAYNKCGGIVRCMKGWEKKWMIKKKERKKKRIKKIYDEWRIRVEILFANYGDGIGWDVE
jgi:hypothetical protein